MIRLAFFSSALTWCTAMTLAAAPATPPDAATLHAQAIEAFRAQKIGVAAMLMEKAYAATPPEQRTRPLVLNRAIIDLTQRTYAMRAARALADYLRNHEAYDEQAQDILGAALDVAAQNPRVKQGEAWQTAYGEWARRDEQVSVSRPGYRRWGPMWLDDAQYARLQADRQELERAIDNQSLRVDRAATRVGSLAARQQAARENDLRARQQAIANWNQQRTIRSQWEQHQRQLDSYPARKAQYDQWVKQQQAAGKPLPRGLPTEAAPPPSHRGNVVVLLPTGSSTPPTGGPDSEYARLAGDIYAAQQELTAERDTLFALQAQLAASNRPPWPKTFDVIEPTETQPPPPPPPDPKAVAALMQNVAESAARAKSPFGADSATTRPASATAATAPSIPPAAAAALPVPSGVPFGPREIDNKR